MEAFASRLETIAIRLEGIVIRLEAIATVQIEAYAVPVPMLLCCQVIGHRQGAMSNWVCIYKYSLRLTHQKLSLLHNMKQCR